MKFCFAVLLLLSFSTREMLSQSDRASVTGVVHDTSGAVIQAASVTATNKDTNLQRTSLSDGEGAYTLLNLPIGRYDLVCKKEGFEGARVPSLDLAIGESLKIDLWLTIGGTFDIVNVVSDPPPLQTQTSSISTNLDSAAVTELPLNVQGGRNLSQFMFAYVPGVEGTDYNSHIDGSLSFTKGLMIDGSSAVSQIGGYLSESSPPMEAVQEFQVTSAGVSEDEQTGGGTFRYEMKSGTNAFHGTGFFFMHNEAFDAASWGNKYNEGECLAGAQGDPSQTANCERAFGKPDDRLYDYGASFGGPIKREKLFFYAAWERYTFANAGIGALSSTVPTEAFLDGDFSALLGDALCNQAGGVGPCSGGGTPIIVSDTSGNSLPAQQNMIFDESSPSCQTVSGCPQFAGNIIPADRISKVSAQVVDLYRQYYPPLSPTLTNNNALPSSSPATWYQSNEASVKLDYELSRSHRLDGSFIYAYIPRLLSDQGGIWAAGTSDGGPLANAYDHNTSAPSVRVRDSWTISSSLLNVAGVTYNRFRNPSEARSREGNWPLTLGIGNFGAGNFPIIKFQGINSDQHNDVAGLPIDETILGSQFNDFYAANTFVYGDALSWVRGRHTWKFGVQFRAQEFNSHGDYGVPTIIFDPAQTAGPFAHVSTCPGNSLCGGFGFASFLLGGVNQASISEPDPTYGRRKSVSLFVHDDIKLTRRLTLNADLRWDFNGRYHEKFGHWSNFNTNEINPVTGLVGALDFASGGSDSFEKRQYYHNVSGLLGAAFQVTPKTVMRGSFGVFYIPLNLNTYSGIPYAFNPGFVLNNQVLAPFDWDGGYPGQAVDIGKNPNFTRYGMVAIDPAMLELGNVQSWSAGVQREIGHGFIVEANIVGNHGYHIESGYVRANQPNLAAYTALVESGQQYAWITEPGFSGFGWASVAPFPNVAMTYGPLFFVGSPLGNTDYRSLQITVRKRTSHGLSLLAGYNLSASHGDVDNAFEDLYYAGPIQDIYDLQSERHTISSFDQTHIVKGYVLYELPFGHGKAFSPSSPVFNGVITGWTVSGDFHYASGMPMRIVANVYYPGINNVYADIVPGCDIRQHYNGKVGGAYFNPACFTNPSNGDFGTAPGYLSALRNPGLATEDLALSKTMHFGERCNFHLYFQMFNVFNRHGFAGPNTQIGADGFGEVLPQDLNGLPGPRVGQFAARFVF